MLRGMNDVIVVLRLLKRFQMKRECSLEIECFFSNVFGVLDVSNSENHREAFNGEDSHKMHLSSSHG